MSNEDIIHGTNATYTSRIYKCRCDACKKAHADANYKGNLSDRKNRKEGEPKSRVQILKDSIKEKPTYIFVGKRK